MSSKIPLRARKKAKVREALISASFRLFSQKGYTETTLEEICEQCDVTVQTLLRYFGSKDDLLFAKHQTILARVSSGLAQAVKKKSSVTYWVKFLHSNALLVSTDKEVGQTYKIIVGAPSLLARFYAISRQYQSLLESALSQEVGLKAGEDLHATLFSQLIVMGPIEEALRAIARGNAGSLVKRLDEVAQFVVDNYKRPARRANEHTLPRRKSAAAVSSKRRRRWSKCAW